ncbi:hypothetical protein [Chryseobacterium fistulae]|nr:hypothetical protein [Chryseobacterium fistulae]
MKSYIIISLLLVFVGCSKKIENNPFESTDTYNIIEESINELKKDKLTANDSIYYLFLHKDSLIVLSLSKEKFKVITQVQKKGILKINNDKIVITKEIDPKYDIFKLAKPITLFPDKIPNYNDRFTSDYLKGIVYKVDTKGSSFIFKQIYKGDLTGLFKNKKEYDIPIIEIEGEQ